MNTKDHIQNLMEIVQQVAQAEKHLKISYKRCQKIGLKGPHTEEALIEFEALTGRFARLVDMLVHKLFRAIDAVELVDTGTLLDAINRAEKRGIIDLATDVRALKDLRNEIAHEYLAEKLTLLHQEVYNSAQKLFPMVDKSIAYANKYK
jgi:uncharacterized protein YutE (UPF0331/DUF86 family)